MAAAAKQQAKHKRQQPPHIHPSSGVFLNYNKGKIAFQ
jgi:hypothetical protein